MGSVTIPIGPQHPALKEPANFSITVAGEKILHTSSRLGYNHRGMEKACEQRTYIQDLYLLERICGICSHSHSMCFAQAVEEIAGLNVPPRALYIRTLIGELERIHSHLLWLGVAGHEIGFDTLLMYSWRDRELVMDLLAMFSGNRVNYGINTIGGVRRDVSDEQIVKALNDIDALEERTKYYIDIATTEPSFIARLAGVGYISHEDAVRLQAVGPTGRGSNVPHDMRACDPYAAYGEMDFKVITDSSCDVYGRAVVRLLELMESYRIIRQALREMPDGPVSVKAPRTIPAGDTVSRVEAPRGEDLHYVKGNGSDKPERVKVRASTLANIQAVNKMMENNNLADVPIIIAAIDPCFSCTDRCIQLIGSERGDMGLKALRQHGIDWYRKNHGIEFGALAKKLQMMRGERAL
ncbi:hydrogenase large subunit [Pelobacter propionicus]|uniref:NADH dehydrogenase (Ubiquinone) n=1 Tax=Pelobacter propionicus (strain DSM 2379 / NBRC 103807 / OttBd1) TaxID=338966 RepID=A1ALK6_PELPD|nr:nickel-dependent hydrogenase large subunit [Pelobacter propionicus]ABK98226.1 NADH dehydrogenase (ubiquinone) [Pelobacter propionicus DSM 2379]